MSKSRSIFSRRAPVYVAASLTAATLTLALGLTLSTASQAQTAPAGPTAAQQAIKARKAVYTLIGSSFGPLNNVAQGKAPYDNAEVLKRAERLALLARYAQEVYPDISNGGETKAKPEIWSNRAEFDSHNKQLVEDANTLLQAVKQDGSASDSFKGAVSALGKDCKGCHDTYRAS